MRIRFWGTRGSMAKPGPTTLRYGGNTSCVEVRPADGTLIVLDCGTGAHELGQALAAAGQPVRGHLLLTHMHWDHIQGFPFFAPLFIRDNEWDVHAPAGFGKRLEDALAGQMESTYFPVTLAQLDATLRFHQVEEGGFDLGTTRVRTRYLNHPAIAIAYRLETDGVSVVYATDHEPHSPHQPAGTPGGAPVAVHREDVRHVEFLAGADLVIHDAQYTLAEYPGKVGWGHSAAEHVVDYAVAARARRLALFHHDPLRSDDAVDALVDVCRQRAAATGAALDVFAAAEGQVVELSDAAGGNGSRAWAPDAPAPGAPARATAATILIVDDEQAIVDLLRETLEPEGFRILSARNGERALEVARAERPDLLLLDLQMPGRSGLEVCRTLRAEPDARLREVPVVLLTAHAGPEDTAAGFAAGVTDYLAKPFRPSHIRSRVHTWLLRRRP